MSREVELGCESWTSFASGFNVQQQCNGRCPCDSAQAWQLKQQLRSALVTGQWQGDAALHFYCSSGSPWSFRSFSGGSHSRAFTLSSPSPLVSVPNKPPCFCGCKAEWSGPVQTTSMKDHTHRRPVSWGGGGGGGVTERQNKKKHTKRTSWFHVFEYTKEMWAGDRVCQFSLAHVLVHKLPTLATKMLCKFALASCSLVTVACMCILMWCC